MQEQIPEEFKISPSLVYFMVASMQVGIGILGYQRSVTKYSYQDAWISVLLAGLLLHIIVWMIYKIAEEVNGDIVTAHEYVVGKIVGKIISSLFIPYFFIYALTVLRSYIEVIQVWMFPEVSTFWFTFAFMILCIYIIYGGFRVVVGIAFFGLVIPSYLFLTFGYNIKYADFSHLLPIFDTSIKNIILGSYQMSLTLVGFEIILFFYPFIKEPQKSKKWAHFALLTSTLLYTGLMILAIAYFSELKIEKSIWATLTMWKIVQLPFVERFEYIGIASWNLVILPNVCVSIWVASRLIKRIFHLKHRNGVVIIALFMLIIISFIDTREKINVLNNFTGKMGFGFTFIYIPLLYICIMIAKKVKEK
ncbi:GerAB/ArcD/ProY family transporter [Cytobacillus dafuensis]|uniref:GerAB/ArcD/ProY family transporter n=1 Tax=Cytobacillus dafuensis TaxID=1742359 RepID=A0A5B8ZC33_CYTDA|nr:GerAB/ArcD/ProY family transporter [Cytobacillus dafuensis]QED49249.1 GerAB/ArcD/ProY family transporter [Cytobacillus dafuensis]